MATKKKLKTTNEDVFTADVNVKIPSSYVVTLPNGSTRAVSNLSDIKRVYPTEKLKIREVFND